MPPPPHSRAINITLSLLIQCDENLGPVEYLNGILDLLELCLQGVLLLFLGQRFDGEGHGKKLILCQCLALIQDLQGLEPLALGHQSHAVGTVFVSLVELANFLLRGDGEWGGRRKGALAFWLLLSSFLPNSSHLLLPSLLPLLEVVRDLSVALVFVWTIVRIPYPRSGLRPDDLGLVLVQVVLLISGFEGSALVVEGGLAGLASPLLETRGRFREDLRVIFTEVLHGHRHGVNVIAGLLLEEVVVFLLPQGLVVFLTGSLEGLRQVWVRRIVSMDKKYAVCPCSQSSSCCMPFSPPPHIRP